MKRILWLLPVTLVVLFVALAVAGHASRFVGDVSSRKRQERR